MSGGYKEFYELDIWKLGYEQLMRVCSLTETFPTSELYALTSQLQRSANSVIANIAESHGRYHYKDKVRVIYISRGEITETRSHIAVAYGRRYISKNIFITLNEGYKQLSKDLNLYINVIKSN